MKWTTEEVALAKGQAQEAESFVQGLSQSVVRDHFQSALAAVTAAVAAMEAEVAATTTLKSGEYRCLWKGARNAQVRHIALIGSALTIGRGNLVSDVLALRGTTTVAQGTAIAVWDGSNIVFRMWAGTSQEAMQWASAMDGVAQSEAADCSKELRQLAVKQRRGERRRRYGEALFRIMGRLVSRAPTPTAQWQQWQAISQANMQDAVPVKAIAEPTKQACASTSVIGEVPFVRKGMKVKEMRHLALQDDLLMVGREEWHTEETITLTGTTIMATGCHVSVWLDNAMVLRFWLSAEEEAKRWGIALQAAATLFSPKDPTPEANEQAAANHAHRILKAQKVSEELRELEAPSQGMPATPANALRARKFKVPVADAVADATGEHRPEVLGA